MHMLKGILAQYPSLEGSNEIYPLFCVFFFPTLLIFNNSKIPFPLPIPIPANPLLPLLLPPQFPSRIIQPFHALAARPPALLRMPSQKENTICALLMRKSVFSFIFLLFSSSSCLLSLLGFAWFFVVFFFFLSLFHYSVNDCDFGFGFFFKGFIFQLKS